jgi:hypothetical protein
MEGGQAVTTMASTFLTVGGMQVLKNWKWFPLIQKGKTALNRIFSIIVAGAVTLGISYVWNTLPGGGHTILITIPTTSALLIGAFHWASLYIYNETGYTFLSGAQALAIIARSIETPPTAAEPAHPATAAVAVAPAAPAQPAVQVERWSDLQR